ncbi:MAG TPA: hypothetical protein VFM94_11615, partial [Solirubrobacterales bacterium]|nr:hypothetical protein [Solirubrobacterales bacterium]
MAVAASPAWAAYGLHDLDVTFTDASGEVAMQAGSHPFAFTTSLAVNTVKKPGVETPEIEVPDEEARDILSQLPPGLLANPTAVPRCTAAEFATGNDTSCPATAALGFFDLTFGFGEPGAVKIP